MNIELKNKFLYFQKYKLRCSIGKRGISINKKEGDKKTPKGEFRLKYILYRKDRIFKFKTKLKKIAINKKMGWCDDPNSAYYNKIIIYPFKFNAEKLWRRENIYDIIIVIDYNINPVLKNKGSAIFLHIAKKKYQPTDGCVAVNKKNIRLIASKINKKTKLRIY
jgi:L,D-peptidoglycan transpeptidase YkuD (ErfK/YbiS/YcfS/YnhG family)